MSEAPKKSENTDPGAALRAALAAYDAAEAAADTRTAEEKATDIFAKYPDPMQDPAYGLGREPTEKEQKMRNTMATLLAMTPDNDLQTCARCAKRVKTGTRCCGIYAFGY